MGPHDIHSLSLQEPIKPISSMFQVTFGGRALSELIMQYQLQGLNKPKNTSILVFQYKFLSHLPSAHTLKNYLFHLI